MARKSRDEKTNSKDLKIDSDKVLRRVTKSFGSFKSNALGEDKSEVDEVQKHFLRGAWMEGTLKHYNSAVIKLLRFAVVKKIDRRNLLPISHDLIIQFVVWACGWDKVVAYVS